MAGVVSESSGSGSGVGVGVALFSPFCAEIRSAVGVTRKVARISAVAIVLRVVEVSMLFLYSLMSIRSVHPQRVAPPEIRRR